MHLIWIGKYIFFFFIFVHLEEEKNEKISSYLISLCDFYLCKFYFLYFVCLFVYFFFFTKIKMRRENIWEFEAHIDTCACIYRSYTLEDWGDNAISQPLIRLIFFVFPFFVSLFFCLLALVFYTFLLLPYFTYTYSMTHRPYRV